MLLHILFQSIRAYVFSCYFLIVILISTILIIVFLSLLFLLIIIIKQKQSWMLPYLLFFFNCIFEPICRNLLFIFLLVETYSSPSYSRDLLSFAPTG